MVHNRRLCCVSSIALSLSRSLIGVKNVLHEDPNCLPSQLEMGCYARFHWTFGFFRAGRLLSLSLTLPA